MKKYTYLLLVGSALLMSAPAFAEDRAVEININGIGPPVDEAAVGTVRQVIGHAVARGVIDKFIVLGYGIEGGFSACAEASPHRHAKHLETLVRSLRSICPDPQTTGYSVNLTRRCGGNRVACAQDAKICPDGSSVGRVPPFCEFAPCPGDQ